MFRIQTNWSTMLVKIRRSKTQVQNSDNALVKMRISADILFKIQKKWSNALVKIRNKSSVPNSDKLVSRTGKN